jgi:hypothetical protein
MLRPCRSLRSPVFLTKIRPPKSTPSNPTSPAAAGCHTFHRRVWRFFVIGSALDDVCFLRDEP